MKRTEIINALANDIRLGKKRGGTVLVDVKILQPAVAWLRKDSTGSKELIAKIRTLPEAEKHIYWDEDDDGNEITLTHDGDDGTYCVDRFEVIRIIETYFNKPENGAEKHQL